MLSGIHALHRVLWVVWQSHPIEHIAKRDAPVVEGPVHSASLDYTRLQVHVGEVTLEGDVARFDFEARAHGLKDTSSFIVLEWVVPKDGHVSSVTAACQPTLHWVVHAKHST